MNKVRVVLFGVGRVGSDVTRLISARPGFRIVAAYSRNRSMREKTLERMWEYFPWEFK